MKPPASASTQRSLSTDSVVNIFAKLHEANQHFTAQYPGDRGDRQPVHTVYGGAHMFKAETPRKLGDRALHSLNDYAPSFAEFARALLLPGHELLPKANEKVRKLEKLLRSHPSKIRERDRNSWLFHTIYERVINKLKNEPVEDYRIDFEDGYGYRSDSEEDHHAQFCAKGMARGMREGQLPPFIGIRIKPMTEELRARAVRTLDIFVSTLVHATNGLIPQNFVITIPKVTIPEQVTAVVTLSKLLEQRTSIPPGSLSLELMIETPQSILNSRGQSQIPNLITAGEGRIRSVHFGPYDYTALCDITAMHQSMQHPACDFARHMMKVALAQTGVRIADGPTNIMPVAPYRSVEGKKLSARQREENKVVVHRAWKLAFDDTMHSLRHGIYQGWDLHPAQLPVRYAAVYLFFLGGLDLATLRLRSFMEKAAQASMVGDLFDDAATGQGLLNYFLRGLSCRAITEDEALATGLTLEELKSRSFAGIMKTRTVKAQEASVCDIES